MLDHLTVDCFSRKAFFTRSVAAAYAEPSLIGYQIRVIVVAFPSNPQKCTGLVSKSRRSCWARSRDSVLRSHSRSECRTNQLTVLVGHQSAF